MSVSVSYDDVRNLLKHELGWENIGTITILNDTANNRDALTFAVAGPEPVIVRIGNITEEVLSYRSLEAILPDRVPCIIASDCRSFMIRDSIKGLDLCSYVAHREPERSCAMLKKILSESAEVWQNMRQNHQPATPRFTGMLDRIEHYRGAIDQAVLPINQRLVVNGMICPSLESIFDVVDEHYRLAPDFIHLTVGDPWPGNIIVKDNDEFVFIDSHQRSFDWVEDLVRLGQWRKFHLAQEVELISRQINSRREITCSHQFPHVVSDLETVAFSAGEQFAQSINDRTWLRRFWIVGCFAYLRDAARLKNDSRWTKQPEHRLMEICLALEYFNQFNSLAR